MPSPPSTLYLHLTLPNLTQPIISDPFSLRVGGTAHTGEHRRGVIEIPGHDPRIVRTLSLINRTYNPHLLP